MRFNSNLEDFDSQSEETDDERGVRYAREEAKQERLQRANSAEQVRQYLAAQPANNARSKVLREAGLDTGECVVDFRLRSRPFGNPFSRRR
jgi:hypothetical protein